MKLTTFTAAYSQTSVVFPYILAAPSYFLGRITLGQFQQTASAFARVEGSLSFFITSYTTLAAYKATTDRLTTFNAGDDQGRGARAGAARGIVLVEETGRTWSSAASGSACRTGAPSSRPTASRSATGEATLVTGPSGSGKSTLFRALAGIWPFGDGLIACPRGESMLVLPQRPYIPMGTLRAAVAYPGLPTPTPTRRSARR